MRTNVKNREENRDNNKINEYNDSGYIYINRYRVL